jgi:geranylgeranylglycerol-phosphate geranylgeranyltransferase
VLGVGPVTVAGGSALRGAVVAHVQTWRPYTLWYVGLLGLAGAGLGAHHREVGPVLVAWATPTVCWLGAHYLGDYFDRELDRIAKPHRPIPSGRLHPRVALLCGGGCGAGVVALAVAGGWLPGLVAALAVAGIFGYSTVFKAVGLAGNLVRGLLGALAVVYGALVTGPPAWPAVLALAVAFWCHDTASNLVGTLRAAAGVAIAAAGYAAAIGALAVAGWLTAAGPVWFALLAVVAVVGAGTFAVLWARRAALSARAALRAHEVLVLERVTLAALATGAAFGPALGWAVYLPAIALTAITQALMRSRHELGPAPPSRVDELAG